MNSFWDRFTSSYVNELRQWHLYQKSKYISEKLMVGDIVLICDDKRIPRNKWRLGKVEELAIGKDGNIRGAKLLVVSMSESKSTSYCPIKNYFILRLITNQKNRQIKREVNKDEVDANKGHMSDIKSTKTEALEGKYNRILRYKYGWQVNRGRLLKLENDVISSRLFSRYGLYKLEAMFSQ